MENAILYCISTYYSIVKKTMSRIKKKMEIYKNWLMLLSIYLFKI
ncbi:hypothetical protein SEEPB962_00875 [Salmonella enterica subsp. enterica serovar Paratyphi B str. ATCC 51962]|nr:hypothetical protein SEEPB962_00875 [Salmonella enterica subsp. enterica serovar Paratyphi B str. ATCC 51962]